MEIKNLKTGMSVSTSTTAVYQNNQQSLDNRVVEVCKINNEHEILCNVNFGGEGVLLPFDISELNPINK